MLIDVVQEYDQEKISFLVSLWEKIVTNISHHDDSKKIVSFLAKCWCLSIDDKEQVIYIWLPNEFVLLQVKKFFGKSMQAAIQQIYNTHFKPKLIVFPPFQSGKHPLQANLTKLLDIPTKDLEQTQKITQEFDTKTKKTLSDFFGIMFERKYSFNSFVVGDSNNLAFSAAKAVAEKPGEIHNPLFLYGNVGLWKTHLMQSIGNTIMENQKEKVITYMPASKLIDEIVSGIRRKKLNELLHKFDGVDVLMIDDIQFLADKEKTQEIFHNIFNDFVSKKKQVVMTSDRPPKELNNIEARLKSRFGNGLVCDIKNPDYETRFAILKEKIKLNDNPLEDDYLEIIAQSIKDNVRELEGALNLFATQQKLLGKHLEQKDIYAGLKTLGYKTASDISQTLQVSNLNKRNEKNLGSVIEMVGDYYSIATSDIKGDSRKKEHSLARQMLMYIAKKHFSRTLEKIGDYFWWKNHATVIYAIKNFEKIMKSDAQIAKDYAMIAEQMNS